MRCDEAVLVLGLNRRLKEAVHELQCLLLVSNESAAVDALQINVEITLILATADKSLELIGFLGEQFAEVEGLHGIDRDLFPIPLDGP